MVDWLRWVFFGLPREQRAAYQRARALAIKLAKLDDNLSNLSANAETGIRRALDQLKEKHIGEKAKCFSVDRLRSESAIRTNVLHANGYETLADLQGVGAFELKQLPGIGQVGAERIIEAREYALEELRQETPEIPKPDDVTHEHKALLSSLFQYIRARKATPSLLDSIRSYRKTVADLLRSLSFTRSFFRRLFTSRKKREGISQILEKYLKTLNSEEAVRDRQLAQEVFGAAEPPSDFSKLVEDYRDRFADYASALEYFRYEHAGDNAAEARAVHGGVPEEIARRVNAFPLNIEGYDIQLRRYQEFGARYLLHQKRTILGDEMGLGKTAQALAAMTHLSNNHAQNRFLVICPASIIHNWRKEIARCKLTARVLHGSTLFVDCRTWHRAGGVAVTSHQMYLNEVEDLLSNSNSRINFLVVDEAHMVKNPTAKRTQAVLRLAPECERAVFMTGTPLENRVSEFIHLIQICDAGLAEEVESLPASVRGRKHFEKKVAPVYLRRNQEDVLKELPECIEVEEWVAFSDEERAQYRAAIRESGHLMTIRRKVFGLQKPCIKLERTMQIMENYVDEKRKIVIFSYFHDALNAIEKEVAKKMPGQRVWRIDGNAPTNQRGEIIDGFSKEPGFSLMLSQIDAGGMGINLPAASATILTEPQFKPSTEQQAIKRLHRMGQTRTVCVHRLLVRDTIDENLRELVHKKSKIFEDYARNSAIKNAAREARDPSKATIKKFLLEKELERINQSTKTLSPA